MIGAYTPICEEDAHWLPQYLAEVDRLGVYFVMHFDRCSKATKDSVIHHPRCLGCNSQEDPAVEHVESCRQALLRMLEIAGVTLAVMWDVDETWERRAPEKLDALVRWSSEADAWDCARVHWVNLWGEDDGHVRLDNPSNPYRYKLHRLGRGVNWTWKGAITVEPYGVCESAPKVLNSDLVCLHHGLKTEALRRQHKERWDRVYGHHLGKNPYDYWDYLLDPAHPPVLMENIYG